MKKLLFVVAFLVVFGGGIYFGTTEIFNEVKDDVLGYGNPDSQTLIGLSTDLQLLPDSKVFANTTTTAALADGGALTQAVSVKNYEEVYLGISLLGGNATATAHIQPMISYDATNYYDVLPATTTPGLNGTTTVNIIPAVLDLTPGTATTAPTVVPFDTYGASHMRFIIYGDNVIDTVDSSDGVQAWIEFGTSERFTNS